MRIADSTFLLYLSKRSSLFKAGRLNNCVGFPKKEQQRTKTQSSSLDAGWTLDTTRYSLLDKLQTPLNRLTKRGLTDSQSTLTHWHQATLVEHILIMRYEEDIALYDAESPIDNDDHNHVSAALQHDVDDPIDNHDDGHHGHDLDHGHLVDESATIGITMDGNDDAEDIGNTGTNRVAMKTSASALSQAIAPTTETSAFEQIIKTQKEDSIRDANEKFSLLLRKLKRTAETMSSELSAYLDVAESVEVDYIRCQNSSRNEAKRLREVEPDIAGTTNILNMFE